MFLAVLHPHRHHETGFLDVVRFLPVEFWACLALVVLGLAVVLFWRAANRGRYF